MRFRLQWQLRLSEMLAQLHEGGSVQLALARDVSGVCQHVVARQLVQIASTHLRPHLRGIKYSLHRLQALLSHCHASASQAC